MGVALVSDLSDQSDLSDLSDKMSAPCDTPRVCGAAVWNDTGEDVPQGYARQLDGNGGMRVAWALRLCQTCLTSRTYLTKWGASVYPGGVRCRCGVRARVQMCRRGVLV